MNKQGKKAEMSARPQSCWRLSFSTFTNTQGLFVFFYLLAVFAFIDWLPVPII